MKRFYTTAVFFDLGVLFCIPVDGYSISEECDQNMEELENKCEVP